MPEKLTLPAKIASRAERRTWFCRSDTEKILSWLEEQGGRFLGMDVAEKQADGKWILLIDPILDLSDAQENASAIQQGWQFLKKHDSENRMFDPVWVGRHYENN